MPFWRLARTILFLLNFDRGLVVKWQIQNKVSRSVDQVQGGLFVYIFSSTQNNPGSRLARWNGDFRRNPAEGVIAPQDGAAAHEVLYSNLLLRHSINAHNKRCLLSVLH